MRNTYEPKSDRQQHIIERLENRTLRLINLATFIGIFFYPGGLALVTYIAICLMNHFGVDITPWN